MHDRRAGDDRLFRVDDGREIFVLDVDERRRFFSDVRIGRRDHRDLLAGESHTVPRQKRHVEHPPSHQNVREVPGGENREDPSVGARPGGVDPDDTRMR